MAARSSSGATTSLSEAARQTAPSATRWAGARRLRESCACQSSASSMAPAGAGASERTQRFAARTSLRTLIGTCPSPCCRRCQSSLRRSGPSPGLGAARVAASHFSVMVRGSSQLFVAGPPVVYRAFGREVPKEELGGSHIHAHGSGAVDNEVESEAEAFEHIRRFLSYLPSSVWEAPPRVEPADDPEPSRGGAALDRAARPAKGLRYASASSSWSSTPARSSRWRGTLGHRSSLASLDWTACRSA